MWGLKGVFRFFGTMARFGMFGFVATLTAFTLVVSLAPFAFVCSAHSWTVVPICSIVNLNLASLRNAGGYYAFYMIDWFGSYSAPSRLSDTMSAFQVIFGSTIVFTAFEVAKESCRKALEHIRAAPDLLKATIQTSDRGAMPYPEIVRERVDSWVRYYVVAYKLTEYTTLACFYITAAVAGTVLLIPVFYKNLNDPFDPNATVVFAIAPFVLLLLFWTSGNIVRLCAHPAMAPSHFFRFSSKGRRLEDAAFDALLNFRSSVRRKGVTRQTTPPPGQIKPEASDRLKSDAQDTPVAETDDSQKVEVKEAPKPEALEANDAPPDKPSEN